MNLPEYITREEGQRVCRETGLSDWTQRSNPRVDLDEEANIIQEQVGGETAWSYARQKIKQADEDFLLVNQDLSEQLNWNSIVLPTTVSPKGG